MERGAYKKRWPGQNLGSMITFLEGLYPEGILLSRMASDTGLTVQSLSDIFRHDDMKLSKAEDLARRLGYELRLYFPQKQFLYGRRPEKLKLDPDAYSGSGNLRGLAIYIHDCNKSIGRLAIEMGRSHRLISTAILTGDTRLSTLTAITRHLGIECEWRFTPIEDPNEKYILQ